MSYEYKDGIETERLITRFLTLEDAEVWKNFFEDKEAIKYLNLQGVVDPVQLAKNWMERTQWRYSVNKLGFQAVLLKETKELIGICGLLLQDVNGEKMVEIGYHFMRKHWGKGYATEIAAAFKNYAFNTNLTDKVVSLINIHNTPSQRVAERNDMTRGKQIWWFEQDIYVYEVKASTIAPNV